MKISRPPANAVFVRTSKRAECVPFFLNLVRMLYYACYAFSFKWISCELNQTVKFSGQLNVSVCGIADVLRYHTQNICIGLTQLVRFEMPLYV